MTHNTTYIYIYITIHIRYTRTIYIPYTIHSLDYPYDYNIPVQLHMYSYTIYPYNYIPYQGQNARIQTCAITADPDGAWQVTFSSTSNDSTPPARPRRARLRSARPRPPAVADRVDYTIS